MKKKALMKKLIAVAAIAGAMLLTLAGTSSASNASFKGTLFHDGATIRTVVTTSPVPNGGTDPFYAVTNGAAGQFGIAGVAPSDGPYHGGAWAVYTVTFNGGVTPYLLTSDDAVFAAQSVGDVIVTRVPGADFRCPVQP